MYILSHKCFSIDLLECALMKIIYKVHSKQNIQNTESKSRHCFTWKFTDNDPTN